MDSVLNMLLVVVLALNLFLLGNSRLSATIRIVAAQGALIGVMPLLVHQQPVGFAVFALAVAAIPERRFDSLDVDARPARGANQARGRAPGRVSTLDDSGRSGHGVCPGVCRAFAFGPGTHVPPAGAGFRGFRSFGFYLVDHAVQGHQSGYWVSGLENGVFIFGLLLIEAMPMIVEMGVLLDLFVGIFVISIIVNHINRAFSSQDTRRFGEQKD
jgi:hydrogenase-4 component E